MHLFARSRRPSTMVALAGSLALALLPAVTVPHAVSAAQVLRISDEGVQDLGSIDPPTPEAGDAQSNLVENLIFGGLVRLDENFAVQPDAADHWNVSKDGKVYTFTLRKNLRFGDGTPLSASDVVWSFTRAFAPAYASGAVSSYLGQIVGGAAVTAGKTKVLSGVRALNARTVQITLTQASAVFLDELAYSVAYLTPRQTISTYGKNWTDHAVGTGPFMVGSWHHGQEVDLVPNPYYWRGKPQLAGVNVLFVQNTETAYNLYKTGGVDVMGAIDFPSNHIKDVQGMPDLHQQAQLFTEYLTLNEHKAPFNNPLVREAFSYAINRASITALLNERFLPAKTMLPPGMPGFNASSKGQYFDVNRARELLAKAGYPDGKGLPPVTISVDGGDSDGSTKGDILRQFWKQVLGVDVSINQLEHGAYNDALTARNFQIAFIQWGADYPDPQDFLSLQFQSQSNNNNGYYHNALFDKLTAQADILSHDSPERYRLYQQAEQLLLNEAGIIVLDWGKKYVLIKPSIKGLIVNGLGMTAPDWTTVTL